VKFLIIFESVTSIPNIKDALENVQLVEINQMVIGITMLKVMPGQEKACYDALRHAAGMKEIYHLFGEFDFFLILEAADKKDLILLLEDIRARKHVLGTWSLLVSDYESHPTAGRSFSAVRNPFYQEMADSANATAAKATAVNASLASVTTSNVPAGNATSA